MLTFRERYYTLEKITHSKPVDKHPLQRHTIDLTPKNKATDNTYIKSSIVSKRETFLDPLDPLSALSSSFNVEPERKSLVKRKEVHNIEPWSSKRLTILTTYTTSEKLSIVSSFLTTKPNENVKIIAKSVDTSDKNKVRLEQVDQFDEEVRETSNLSCQQFTDKMSELSLALRSSWGDGQRVKTLQIVIQITKLLSEASVAQFFPSKFVLVTDLVDCFANLVYDRLRAKSAYCQRGSKLPIELPELFSESQVPDVAKETARNWFYKVASIRELVARLYVEAALLQCHKFCDSSVIAPTLIRLMRMARGIADPLLAAYARAYVARVGVQLLPTVRDYIKLAFTDILHDLSDLSTSQQPYLRTFMPAVDWLLHCLCAGANEKELASVLDSVEAARSPLLLHAALCSMDPVFIRRHASRLATSIAGITELPAYPTYTLYRQLGVCVSMAHCDSAMTEEADPVADLQLLKLVWRAISGLTETRHFVECADAWAEFVARRFDHAQLTRFLGQMVKLVKRDADYREYYSQLHSILNKLLSCECDFESLFASPEFVQYLALFDKEHVIIEARQTALTGFLASEQSRPTISDPVVIQACVRMLKEMYDSLNSLSMQDNRRIVTTLSLSVLDRIRFESRHVERELELLTEFRSQLGGGLELVTLAVVERVNALAMRVRSLRPEQQHNSGSAGFVRACMAFSYITVASVGRQDLAVRLYTSTAQVALVNECLGQSEACIKEAIHLLSKLESGFILASGGVVGGSSSNTNLSGGSSSGQAALVAAELAANIGSTLLMCPDIGSVMGDSDSTTEASGKSNQTIYLLKGLINAIHMCPALKTDHVAATNKSQIKADLYTKVLLLLAALSQPEYEYHAGRTDANDRIYGGSDQFQSVLADTFAAVLAKLRVLGATETALRKVLMNVLHFDTASSQPQSELACDWLADLTVDC